VTRQPDFATSPRRNRMPSWESLALAAGLAALGLSAAGAWRARQEAAAARARLADVRREVDAAAARQRTLQALARGPARGLPANEAPPSRIVADLASAIPAGVRLEKLLIDYSHEGAVEMDVVARDAAAWDRLLARLEDAPWLREVQPGPESRAGEVRTLVRARWVGGGS
jgi:Tfp pilus assembly protein PilN